MPRRDTTDFALAFTLGAIAGAIAAYVLRPAPPRRAWRLLDDLEPIGARLRGEARRVRRAVPS